MPRRFQVLLTTPATGRSLYEHAVDILERAGFEVFDTGSQPVEEAVLARLAPSADAILATLAPLGAPVIEAGTKLRVIAKVGAGVDNIDVAAATSRGIPVCNTPGVNADSVADHVFALILALARGLLRVDELTRAGMGWEQWPPLLGAELRGKTVGIIGFGRTGQAVARRATAFGMSCRIHDPYAAVSKPPIGGFEPADLDDVLTTADFITLHVPLSEITRGLIGTRELALMRPTSFLINTARGPVVDERALVSALENKRIRGAGIDVFAEEPATSSPLFDLENVVVTPHVAGMTTEATTLARKQAAESIVVAARGQAPPRMVNAV